MARAIFSTDAYARAVAMRLAKSIGAGVLLTWLMC